MELERRIAAFAELGSRLRFALAEEVSNRSEKGDVLFREETHDLIGRCQHTNGWFSPVFVKRALSEWAGCLTKENLTNWLAPYALLENDSTAKKVAVIMAGNIPMVGFHDFLSVLVTGNSVEAKLSAQDSQLLPHLAKELIAIEPEMESVIRFSEGTLSSGIDAAIATGSNNSARYFEYYFSKYPNVIRKNRSSVAILTGDESGEQLEALCDDIFCYYGLGCRNVSKLYVPPGYDFDQLFEASLNYSYVADNNKYMNNYSYNKTLYLMNQDKLLDNDLFVLKEESSISSPVGVLFYEYYTDRNRLDAKLESERDELQCVVGEQEIEFGNSQSPDLSDYADNVDTVKFLIELN